MVRVSRRSSHLQFGNGWSWVQNDNFWFDFRFLPKPCFLPSTSFPHDKSCNHYFFSFPFCNISTFSWNPLPFWIYILPSISLLLSFLIFSIPTIQPPICLFLSVIKEQFSFFPSLLLPSKGLLPSFLYLASGPWAASPWVCLWVFFIRCKK